MDVARVGDRLSHQINHPLGTRLESVALANAFQENAQATETHAGKGVLQRGRRQPPGNLHIYTRRGLRHATHICPTIPESGSGFWVEPNLYRSLSELLAANCLPQGCLVKYADGPHAGQTLLQARTGAPHPDPPLQIAASSASHEGAPKRKRRLAACQCQDDGVYKEARSCMTCKVSVLGKELTEDELRKMRLRPVQALAAETKLKERQVLAMEALQKRQQLAAGPKQKRKAAGPLRARRVCEHGRRVTDCLPCGGSSTCLVHAHTNKYKCAECKKARTGHFALAGTSPDRAPGAVDAEDQ